METECDAGAQRCGRGAGFACTSAISVPAEQTLILKIISSVKKLILLTGLN